MKHASSSHPSSMLHICLYEILLPPWSYYHTLHPGEHLLSMEFVDVAPFCSSITLNKTCFSLKLQPFPKNVQWAPGFTPNTRGSWRPTAGGGPWRSLPRGATHVLPSRGWLWSPAVPPPPPLSYVPGSPAPCRPLSAPPSPASAPRPRPAAAPSCRGRPRRL